MIRKSISAILFTLAVITFLFPITVSATSESNQMAYVDSQRIVDESVAGQSALSQLEEFKKQNEKELTERAREIAEKEEESRKKKFALSPEAQEKIEETIRRKNIDLKRFKEDKEMEMKELYFKHLNKIKEEIVQIVQQLGQEKNYLMILNKDDSVLYVNPASDITNQIIEIYDKKISEESKK